MPPLPRWPTTSKGPSFVPTGMITIAPATPMIRRVLFGYFFFDGLALPPFFEGAFLPPGPSPMYDEVGFFLPGLSPMYEVEGFFLALPAGFFAAFFAAAFFAGAFLLL